MHRPEAIDFLKSSEEQMCPKRWWVETVLNTSTWAAPASPALLSSAGGRAWGERGLCAKGAQPKARQGKTPLGRLFQCCSCDGCCGSGVAEPWEVPGLCCPVAQQHEHPLPAPALQPVLPLHGGCEAPAGPDTGEDIGETGEQLSKLPLCQKQSTLFISLKEGFWWKLSQLFNGNISRYLFIGMSRNKKILITKVMYCLFP